MSDEAPWTQEDADWWGPIVCPAGEWDIEQVKRELRDYRAFLDEVSAAYCDLTGGRISKPNTAARVVISEHGDVCTAGAPERECPGCGLDRPWACVECGRTLR